jgi:aspartate/tyrosine/aromatic aminotransferase
MWERLASAECAGRYASGDLDKDAFAVRAFIAAGIECLVCQS